MSEQHLDGRTLAVSTRKNLNKVLTVTLLYFWFGLIWYFIGPIDYQKQYNQGAILLAVFVALYFLAFQAGFILRVNQFRDLTPRPSSKGKVLSFLRVFIWINLVFTVLNCLQYTYTLNFSELLQRFQEALEDPGTAYFSKISAMKEVNTSYSILTYITVFLAPFLFPTLTMSLYYFKDLGKLQKLGVIATLFFEIVRWVSIGTNKGLLDVFILVFTVLVLRALQPGKIKPSAAERRKRRRRILIALLLIVGFVAIFSHFLVSRSSKYPAELYASFPYSMVPESLRAPLYKLTSYLCQGYRSMQHILVNLDWEPTWGVGNSTFLLSVVYRLTGLDLSVLTYQTRICATGLVAPGAFQSAFAYFANDLSFVGVIFLMLICGYYLCTVLKEAIVDEDPISITLIYMLFLGILNISCLNYMLAFSNMFVGFWGLFLVRIIKRKCSITIGRIRIT